ncbi:hypothetical protein MSPP1_004056 [Malassezia sp. CBS 17886]|nr:hypothetical protein MSPP1_004056 [Malassezia sp. CBS 17886]
MCGRFANGLSHAEFEDAVEQLLPPHRPHTLRATDYHPTYNVAPNTRYPIVRRAAPADRADDGILMETMRWGVSTAQLPHRQQSEPHLVINARDDAIVHSRLWSELVSAHRGVVFCQGYYEWMKRPVPGAKPRRVPYFVGMDAPGTGRPTADGRGCQLMAIAALYLPAPGPAEARAEARFTICTTRPSQQLEFLHDRMPVLLPHVRAVAEWLGVATPGAESRDACSLLRPYQGHLACYKVPAETG